jgi:hypothetical protein
VVCFHGKRLGLVARLDGRARHPGRGLGVEPRGSSQAARGRPPDCDRLRARVGPQASGALRPGPDLAVTAGGAPSIHTPSP